MIDGRHASGPGRQARRARISTWQLMVVIAAFAFGLAISPPEEPYLAVLPPMALWLARLRPWPIAIPSRFFLMLCALVEIGFVRPVAGWIYAPIAILISGPLWPVGPNPWRPRRLIPLIGVNSLILALILIPWSHRKVFMRDLYSIKLGMTVAEANRIMAGYKKIPTSEVDGIIFLHSDDPVFRNDWGVVTLDDGKVIDVNFYPD